MVETSHYAVLRVPVNATPDQIRAAYKRRAIETHPDKTNDDGEAFKAVQAAYTILQDASRRAWYDREQVTPPRPPFAAARRPPTEQDYDEMKRRAAEVAAGLDRAAARRSAEAQRAAAWKAHLAREAREREVVKLVEAAQTKVYRQHYAPDDVRALAAEPKKLKAYQKKHAKFLQEFEKHAKPAIDGATFTQADADRVLERYAAAG